MILSIKAITNVPDLIIDYIEIKLRSGEEVSLNWDESYIDRTQFGFHAKYKGVYFGEEYANGRLGDLCGLKIEDIGFYSEADVGIDDMKFDIFEMEFEEEGSRLTISGPKCPINK